MNFFPHPRGGSRTTSATDATTARASDGPARSRTAVSRTVVFAALALLAWGAAFARSAQVFAPDSIYVQPFNSDSALPVLMSNDPVIDLFRAYNYGQDQIGAYPFLFCQLVRRAAGVVWTDKRIYLLQAFWLFLSVFAVAALGRRTRLVAPALFVVVLCLHPLARHYIFVLNQRYAWQITPLLFAWWTYRRLCAPLFAARSAAPHGVSKQTLLLSLVSFVVSFVFSFLAVWASPLSAPMLLCFFALEACRARIVANDGAPFDAVPKRATNDQARTDNETEQPARDERGGARSPRSTLARLVARALPLAAAVFVERLLKAAYHRHSLKHFGTDFQTPTQIDWGHLGENLRAQLSNLKAAPLWWLVLPALLVAPFVAAALLRALVKGRAHAASKAHARPASKAQARGADQSLGASRFSLEGARLDAAVLALGSLAVALINFASAFLFLWIRLNSYGGRYLALTHLFGTFAGLVALFLLLALDPRVYAARRVVFPALAACCALVLVFKFPPVAKNPEYENLRAVADGLAERDPRAVLLGGYWDTYVFAALRPGDAFTPVPAEDQLVRTPWTPPAMRASERVVVVHHPFNYSGEIESPQPYNTFGDGRQPPPLIKQHGATLRLETPHWYERGGYVFSLYRNETSLYRDETPAAQPNR